MFTQSFNQISTLILVAILIIVVFTCGGCGGHHHEDEHQHDDHHHHHHEHEHSHQHHKHQHDHYDHNHAHHHNHQDHDHDHGHNNQHKEDHHHTKEIPQQTRVQPMQPQLQMIEDKPRLLQTLKLTPITVFFYGTTATPEYQEFTQVIPAYNDEFFSKIPMQIQFAYVSSDKFKLARPNPSLSIYRNINNGEWLMYRGIFEKSQILNWITSNVVDPLKELTGEELDEFFVQGKKGFILLDFGQFYLLKPKIMISQFCQKFELNCGKVSHTNKALNMIIQLMRVEKEPGIPKLSYWNPKTQQLEIYTKDVGHITETQLMQLYSGHESVIPYESDLDVGKVIHPETEIIEVNQNDPESQL